MKIIEIVIGITGLIAAVFILLAITGKKGIEGLTSDSFTGGFLPTDAAEIANNPSVLNNPISFHDPTTDMNKVAPAPGTYVSAKDPIYGAPLAFTVVGGVDNTPKTQTLFGSQGSGYGGISAGGGSAGASGTRSTPGTWTSTGFQRS